MSALFSGVPYGYMFRAVRVCRHYRTERAAAGIILAIIGPSSFM